ncbi:MAG: ABC transporter ATP-binding protein [Blautia sp.]|nr:ABC transporter ATP-binding protein [Blautia sp.]
MAEHSLLSIKDLRVDLMSIRGIVYALDGVNLELGEGLIHGLVGESGCGKSMTARSILRLHDGKRSRMSGEILFEGKNLLSLSEREMQDVRGKQISMIFQDPMNSLNPLYTIGEQISETVRRHEKCGKTAAKARTLQLLGKVGINPPDRRYRQYPFELSGGLQQRVMIAMASACRPKLLIADEPTTALDVTIQAHVLELIHSLSGEMGMSVLLITHNFGIVAEVCDRVSVMYAGRIVETADTRDIFRHPAHPYTKALIESIPKAGTGEEYLPTIPGTPPELFERDPGCPYRDRCPRAGEACKVRPMDERIVTAKELATEQLQGIEAGHTVACWQAAQAR